MPNDRVASQEENAQEEWACLQESPVQKAAWQRWAQQAWPLGRRVKVVAVDSAQVNHYLGQTGEIIGYDLGSDGEYPRARVRLADGTEDSFYCDGQDAEIADMETKPEKGESASDTPA